MRGADASRARRHEMRHNDACRVPDGVSSVAVIRPPADSFNALHSDGEKSASLCSCVRRLSLLSRSACRPDFAQRAGASGYRGVRVT